ncbi:sulfotransferase [Pseudomonadota bacterium]
MNKSKIDFQPIFVVGCSRSGTTLMSKILNRNKDVHSFHELHYFERLWNADKSVKLSDQGALELCAKLLLTVREGRRTTSSWQEYLEEAASLGERRSDQEITGFDIYRIVLDAETRKHEKRHACEQTPRNVFYLKSILEEFPGSQILIMIRDPRAILLSPLVRSHQ